MNKIEQDDMDFTVTEEFKTSLDLTLTPNNTLIKIKGDVMLDLNEMKQLQKWVDNAIKQMREI
ncbi:MAG: hypothetical protein WC783_02860 [Candidatus Paceibacterota bacterium]|jgi:hypothetical protein